MINILYGYKKQYGSLIRSIHVVNHVFKINLDIICLKFKTKNMYLYHKCICIVKYY